jgi:2,2-dialkylglycine decarboxylase (pyruvate)
VNDPLPAAVGLKVVEVVQRDGLAGRAAELGDRLRQGLLLGIEFEALDRGQQQSARALSGAVTDNALKLGLSANIVRTGASDGVMRIAPPLTATEAEIDLGLELLDAALAQTLEQVRHAREMPVLPAVRSTASFSR